MAHLTISGYDATPDVLSNLGNYGVSESSNSVHPMGNPMNHSQNSGFSCPLACPCAAISLKGREFLASVASEARPDFQSLEVRVGNNPLRVIIANVGRGFAFGPRLVLYRPDPASITVSVGYLCANAVSPRWPELFR
jgi:hypothetical protein